MVDMEWSKCAQDVPQDPNSHPLRFLSQFLLSQVERRRAKLVARTFRSFLLLGFSEDLRTSKDRRKSRRLDRSRSPRSQVDALSIATPRFRGVELKSAMKLVAFRPVRRSGLEERTVHHGRRKRRAWHVLPTPRRLGVWKDTSPVCVWKDPDIEVLSWR